MGREAAIAERPKVVVIDDDEMIRELVRLHLKNANYEVLLAEDAVEAGRLIVESSPALILIDVNMPYMNGYDFTLALKNDPATRDIPVVFITADEDVTQRSRELGAAAFLAKPVRADRLLEVVGRFASGAR